MKKNIFFLLFFLSHLLLVNAGTKTVNEASSASKSQSDPWVRETGLQYNMPILARVYKDGALFQPTGLMLAVIKNNKCWGFSGLSNGPGGIKLHNITIGCNNESEAGFNYQCYDPNTSTYYDIVETVDFKSLTPVGKINAPISINIKSATPQTITFGALSAKTFGDAPFTVSATGGASGNPVTFTSSDAAVATCTGTNGETITIIGVGSCTIYANQVGNSNYAAATQASQLLTVVNKIAQTITFDVLPAKTLGNAPFSVSATGGASGNPVIFTSSDPAVATCSGTNGETITIIGVGSCTINANQNGNSSYTAATQASQLLTVGKMLQTISFSAVATKTFGDGSFTVSAIGGISGNPVVFTSSDSNVAICSGVNGTTISISGSGSCFIYANQAGNSNFETAPTATQAFTVNTNQVVPWVRETGLQYNMPIVAQVFKNSLIFQPAGLLLGVFKNNKCWGFSGLSNGPGGIKLHNITIGCNNESEPGFTYLVYDPNTMKYHSVSEKVDFKSLTPVGKINAPIRINIDYTTELPIIRVDKISVYPNPITTTFFFTLDSESTNNVDISIYSADGKFAGNLYNGAISNRNLLTIQREQYLVNGLYFIKATFDGKQITKKVILN